MKTNLFNLKIKILITTILLVTLLVIFGEIFHHNESNNNTPNYLKLSLIQNNKVIKEFDFKIVNGLKNQIKDISKHYYVESVTTGSDSGNNAVQGEFQTGYTGSLRSKILENNKIMVYLDLNISKLIKIEHLTYGTGKNAITIDLPTISHTRMKQPFLIFPQTSIAEDFFKSGEKLSDQMKVTISAYNISDENV